ncbi:hypothetical protein J3D55_000633 [Chryseobacterium ginsenosidimutans]|nr:hypothetical protein [Chryseobacterium ginsenosidimutans]
MNFRAFLFSLYINENRLDKKLLKFKTEFENLDLISDDKMDNLREKILITNEKPERIFYKTELRDEYQFRINEFTEINVL